MASTELIRTPASNGSTKAYTLSFWTKRSVVGADSYFMFQYQAGSEQTVFYINATDQAALTSYNGGGNICGFTTNRKFRDPSAWYHIVVSVDTAQAVAGDRMKFYVNGVQETSFSAETVPTQDVALAVNQTAQTYYLGSENNANFFGGRISHYHYIDGTSYPASTFGSFDATSGIWKINTAPSVTYGTNGFFLKFEDRTNLDLDSGTNTFTNFTTNGTLTATYDNPSNNFTTWNPLYIPTANLPTFENGNTTTIHATTSGAWRTMESTLGVSSGKWYWECIGGNSSGHIYNGVCSPEWLETGNPSSTGPEGEMGYLVAQPSYGIYALNGALAYSNTSGYGTTVDAYTSSYDNTDYTSVYLDLDNHKIYWSINGVIQNSGTGWDLQTGFTYIPCVSLYNSTAAGAKANFGNGTFASTALTGTTYSDDDGIGTFKYSPNYGGAATFDSAAKNFMALCTKNLKAYG